MRRLVVAIALALSAPTVAAAEEIAAVSAAPDDAQLRAERVTDLMMFETGMFVAAISESEPYMNPATREQATSMMARDLPPERAEAVRAYMADFDRRFNEALARERPGIVTRIATGMRGLLTPEEMAALEQFVLGETSGLFVRLVRQYLQAGGELDFSGYSQAELRAIGAFMNGPGFAVFDAKANAFDQLLIAELTSFVPAFERQFVGDICTITGGDCPEWVGRQTP